MTRSPVGAPNRIIAVDTNVFLLLLGYQCLLLDRATGLQRSQVLGDLRGRSDTVPPERFDDLWQLFMSPGERIVTHHVVAEVYGLRRRLRLRKDLVWRAAHTLLDLGIEEVPCSVRQIRERFGNELPLTELGPTDAGLLYVAEDRKATILSEDGSLTHGAGTRGIRSLTLNQIGAI